MTKDMKEQLALATKETRTTRQSAAHGAASAASSSGGKKRSRCVHVSADGSQGERWAVYL